MKKYVAYYNRKTRNWKKKLHTSGDFAGHLRFWLQNIKGRIGESYLQEKSLTLLFLETSWSRHRWERKMKLWENCNANGKITKNKYASYWTRDISSWSLEEKLQWYNITHSVNSSLSIQLWQSVTCPALRRKVILRIASVFHSKRKSWI